LMAPPVFWGLHWIGRVTGYDYLPEGESYE
jgi:hypothetical protein